MLTPYYHSPSLTLDSSKRLALCSPLYQNMNQNLSHLNVFLMVVYSLEIKMYQ